MNGYTDHTLVEEFLEDIDEKNPVLIIHTKNHLTPIFRFKVTSPAIEELTARIQKEYKVTEELRSWTVYECEGDAK